VLIERTQKPRVAAIEGSYCGDALGEHGWPRFP
jgi:hypothetical protein